VIDLHCHILPGIDDGALDLNDSVGMARIAAADGIEVVCATPHIRHDHDVTIPELAGRVEQVNEELRRAVSRSKSSRAARSPRRPSTGSTSRSCGPSRSAEPLDPPRAEAGSDRGLAGQASGELREAGFGFWSPTPSVTPAPTSRTGSAR
jgi:hypothetical protein